MNPYNLCCLGEIKYSSRYPLNKAKSNKKKKKKVTTLFTLSIGTQADRPEQIV